MSQISPIAVAPNDFIDLSWLIGRTAESITFDKPSFWVFKFGPDALISVECLWRIIQQSRVVLTSEDHGQRFGLPAPVDAKAECIALLNGQAVTAASLKVVTADLVITFSSDLRLEIIPTSSGYESWQMRDPTGANYVAQGGGQISKWIS